jgi:hypothetical protein
MVLHASNDLLAAGEEGHIPEYDHKLSTLVIWPQEGFIDGMDLHARLAALAAQSDAHDGTMPTKVGSHNGTLHTRMMALWAQR